MRLRKPTTRWLLLGILILLLLPSAAFAAQEDKFPDVIPLPNGFRPEGIVIGKGTTFYVGSIPTGAIFRGDLRTGEGDLLVEPEAGRSAIGLSYDPRSDLLFVAGGTTGKAFVYDASSGILEGEFTLTTASPTFINDVVVTRRAAYFTDSNQPNIYSIPLSRNGDLPEEDAVEVIPLSGDYVQTPGFNANGIEGRWSGRVLIIVNSSLGALYRVDPESGIATTIPLDGGDVAFGDGLLLKGRTLYVVQNQLNQIAVIQLGPRFRSGEIVETLTSPDFRVPTTIDDHGRYLYAVNARFDTEPTPDTEYEVVRVPKNP